MAGRCSIVSCQRFSWDNPQTDFVDAVEVDVRIHRHVGDGISAAEIFVRRKMPVEDAQHVAKPVS